MPRIDAIRSETLQTADGAQLSLLRTGCKENLPDAKTVVILIPGWCMPATMWRDTMLAMAPVSELIAIDPRGQGTSSVPAGGYNIDQRSDDLAQVVAQCVGRSAKVVMVGWSLGALEALHYVRRHGESKLDGLVLVDSSVGEEPAIPAARAFREALSADRRGTMERFVRAMFLTPRPESEIADLVAKSLRMPLEASLALFPSHLPREHWRDIARSMRAPLLYAITPRFEEQARNLQKARPATVIEIFAEAGHALFVDAPGRFNRVLGAFLQRVSTGP